MTFPDSRSVATRHAAFSATACRLRAPAKCRVGKPARDTRSAVLPTLESAGAQTPTRRHGHVGERSHLGIFTLEEAHLLAVHSAR